MDYSVVALHLHFGETEAHFDCYCHQAIIQYLNYVTSYTCLQELNRTPQHEDRGAKCKNQDGIRASCAKRTVHKTAECNRRMNTHA